MIIRRINVLLQLSVLLGSLLASVPVAWASSFICGSSGTGMGGTGSVARGTGMGGTGIQPENGAAGRVMFSSGRIEARSNGKSRLLAKGDTVCVGDTILSARTASAQLRMVDDETIAVRPGTRMRIDHYAFHGKNDDNIMLSLFEGACRIVSGKIGKRVPQNDLVNTPMAIIGIRGTDHEVAIIPQGSIYPAGVYDKVNRGVTFIRTEKGSIDIHPNQVGFTASQQELPRLLESMPDFYNNPSTSLSNRSNGHDKAESGESGTPEQPEGGSELENQGGSDALSNEPSVPVDTEMGTGTPSLPEVQSVPEVPQPLPEPLQPPEINAPDVVTSPVPSVEAPDQ